MEKEEVSRKMKRMVCRKVNVKMERNTREGDGGAEREIHSVKDRQSVDFSTKIKLLCYPNSSLSLGRRHQAQLLCECGTAERVWESGTD